MKALIHRQINRIDPAAAMVCIDSYKNGIPVGKLYRPNSDSGHAFDSLTQLLKNMEHSLEFFSAPQPYTNARAFFPRPEPHIRCSPGKAECRGQLATFAIRILFRQNSSWQGSLCWLEGDSEQSFRSVLEMINLIDSALNIPAPPQ